MGQRRLLVILLIVATALVDLGIATPFVGSFGQVTTEFEILFGGLATSQISLLSALVARSPIRLPWGLMSVVLTAAYLTVLRLSFAQVDLSASPGYRARLTTEGMVLFLAVAVMTLVLTLIIRATGLRIAMGHEKSVSSEGNRGARLQFTLGHMFAWITTAAVLLGILRYTIHIVYIPRLGPWDQLVTVGSTCSTLAIIAVLSILSTNHLATRIGVLGLASTTMWSVDHWLLDVPVGDALCFVLPQFLWLLAATLVLRVAGYRLVRRGAVSRREASPPLDGRSG